MSNTITYESKECETNITLTIEEFDITSHSAKCSSLFSKKKRLSNYSTKLSLTYTLTRAGTTAGQSVETTVLAFSHLHK